MRLASCAAFSLYLQITSNLPFLSTPLFIVIMTATKVVNLEQRLLCLLA
jgi:hypothetical protein